MSKSEKQYHVVCPECMSSNSFSISFTTSSCVASCTECESDYVFLYDGLKFDVFTELNETALCHLLTNES